jgi:hypothetical protein
MVFQNGRNRIKTFILCIFLKSNRTNPSTFLSLIYLLTYFFWGGSFFKGTPVTPVTPANVVQGLPDPWVSQITNTDTLAAVAQILQSPQGQQVSNFFVTLRMI